MGYFQDLPWPFLELSFWENPALAFLLNNSVEFIAGTLEFGYELLSIWNLIDIVLMNQLISYSRKVSHITDKIIRQHVAYGINLFMEAFSSGPEFGIEEML